ncbi:MAG: PilZ domain-containing protein [Peptococcaceae bacterium]|nr:PilZ domain-containing protein [Peptococcaceae bacterium]
MAEYTRRDYQRGAHFHSAASVSADGEHWHDAEMGDLSSGGLSLNSSLEFAVGDVIWLNLRVEGFMSGFDVAAKGSVRRKQRFADENVYGVAFIGLPQDVQIRIDENARGDRPISGGTYEY